MSRRWLARYIVHSTKIRAFFRRKRVQRSIALALWIALVLWVSLTSAITLPEGAIIGPFISTVGSLLASRYSDRLLDFLLGTEDSPILSFEPLQLTKRTEFNPIQFLSLAWSFGTVTQENGKAPQSTIIQNELDAKFGILRVENIGSDAENCRVTVRYLSKIVHSERYIWVDQGYLNWYSVSKRRRLTQLHEKLRIDNLGILLENISEDIHHKESKYLQVGFFMKQGPAFWLCTDTGISPLLSLWELPDYNPTDPKNLETLNVPDMTNHLQVELTITARNYPVTKKIFDVSVTRDSIQIFEARNPINTAPPGINTIADNIEASNAAASSTASAKTRSATESKSTTWMMRTWITGLLIRW